MIVFSLCAVVGAAAMTFLWQRVSPAAKDFLVSIEADATDFAEDRDQSACVPEAFARLARCEDLACQIQAPIFTRLCLARAEANPAICDEIPTSTLKAATWPLVTCLDIDANPDLCDRILREQLRACLRSEAQPSEGQ